MAYIRYGESFIRRHEVVVLHIRRDVYVSPGTARVADHRSPRTGADRHAPHLGRSDVAEPAKNQPIANGNELDRELIDLMRDLSPEDFQRVKDFVAGLKAARGASSSRRS